MDFREYIESVGLKHTKTNTGYCLAASRPPSPGGLKRISGRAAGERAGLVDFNNYKTSNRLQESKMGNPL